MSTNSVELTLGGSLKLVIDAAWVPAETTGYGVAKRAFDVSAAAVLAAWTLPLMIVVMFVNRIASPGPFLYKQVRVGRNGRQFTMYKIRTMIPDSERETGPVWSRDGDTRVTPFGRFLRRTHLDEMPQLWNILRGDMSLVGPRPERPEFIGPLDAAIPHYPRRLLVLPGLTGLAQVCLPPDSDMTSVRTKLAFDLFYIERQGLMLDLRLCLCTAATLAGVRFPTSRRILRVPSPEAVARAYPGLLYSHESRRRRQPEGARG